jgi:hypothetical protein
MKIKLQQNGELKRRRRKKNEGNKGAMSACMLKYKRNDD